MTKVVKFLPASCFIVCRISNAHHWLSQYLRPVFTVVNYFVDTCEDRPKWKQRFHALLIPCQIVISRALFEIKNIIFQRNEQNWMNWGNPCLFNNHLLHVNFAFLYYVVFIFLFFCTELYVFLPSNLSGTHVRTVPAGSLTPLDK